MCNIIYIAKLGRSIPTAVKHKYVQIQYYTNSFNCFSSVELIVYSFRLYCPRFWHSWHLTLIRKFTHTNFLIRNSFNFCTVGHIIWFAVNVLITARLWNYFQWENLFAMHKIEKSTSQIWLYSYMNINRISKNYIIIIWLPHIE